MQELADEVPYFDAVVDAQSCEERGGEDERGPLAVRGVERVNDRYLGQRAPVNDVGRVR